MEESKKMSVTYTFYLPDHQTDVKIFSKSWDYYLTLKDIDAYLRNIYKHTECSEETATHIREVRKMVSEVISYDE